MTPNDYTPSSDLDEITKTIERLFWNNANRPMLYDEIRKSKKPVDPESMRIAQEIQRAINSDDKK